MSDPETTLSYPLHSPTALEPPVEWAELRQKCPVAHVQMDTGTKARLLTRYGDVRTMLADPRFTRQMDIGQANGRSFGSDDEASAGTPPMAIPDSGEDHTRWRRLVGKWFTAKRMASLRPAMARIADDLIDAMVESGQPTDLKAALGFPLPVYVICDMLGVPAEDRDRFSYWSDSMLNLTRYSQEETDSAMGAFVAYMTGHIEAKRDQPADDLLSELIRAGEAEGEGLTDGELVGTGMALLVAGHETTANMIGKTVGMLLADRSRWERLLADPKLVRTAVEESLRFDANSGFGLTRRLTEDVEIAGETVPSGTTVVCSMAAANRDEEAFDGAADMDLTRSPNPHLAFGAGAHSCLGQALARTELQVTLEVLMRRLPSLELDVAADDLARLEGLLVGGLREVPVRW